MQDALIANMTHMTYGIYVLTTRHGEVINGMIASWVSQVSFEPPLIMVAIHPNRYSHGLVSQSGHFALHSLAREQKALLSRFKGPDPAAKFSSLEWRDGTTGCPILADCIGCLECRVIQTLAPGNHTVFIGEVVHAEFNGETAPLSTLDYEGCYLGKR
jgi:flavin reductase (DIM6/NTAB) family NADH-FMN oxidoreductase RutF